MTAKTTQLLIIDPQNDFCDLPLEYLPLNRASGEKGGGDLLRPQLPVQGAHADMLRLAALIRGAGTRITEITVTLDSHHQIGIERPALWRQADGSPVAPFTQICAADVREGKYLPRDPAHTPRVLRYLDSLEEQGRYKHMVWPVHCELGTWGHNVHADVLSAYNEWERLSLRSVAKVVKGTSPWTEHYSAIMAEVPDTYDSSTLMNMPLLAQLAKADQVLIAGEASSHCVKSTTEHIADAFGAMNMHKIVLLRDCMSPVGGFETQQAQFLADMQARGARVASAREILAELAELA